MAKTRFIVASYTFAAPVGMQLAIERERTYVRAASKKKLAASAVAKLQAAV